MMLRKQPGTTSRLALAISSIWIGLGLIILLGGHAILAYSLWAWTQDESGMEFIADLFGVPIWALWVCMLGALGMDGWVVYSIREERKKARRR